MILYIIVFAYISANKQKIIKEVTLEISKKLSGNVTIGDVELSFFSHFPQISVVLSKVLITDTLFAQHHHAFFQGEKVYARISLVKLVKREPAINGLRIDHGSFYVFTDSTGYSNSYLYTQKRDSAGHAATSSDKSDLKLIELKDVRIIVDDKTKNKLHDLIVHNLSVNLEDRDSSFLVFDAKADILVHSLAFNLKAGSFIQDKTLQGSFDVGYDKKLKQLQVDSIDFKLSGQPFNVTGRFDLVGPDPQFDLRVHTSNILYSFAKSLVTAKIITALSIVDVDQKLDINASLSGPLKVGEPLIIVKWVIKGTHLQTPFFDFDNASFTGYYTNEVVAGLPRKDPNSVIIMRDFSASWQGFQMTSEKIEILNLFRPLMTCDLNSSFSLTKLNDLIGSNSIQLLSGDGTANLTYKGPLEKNDNTNSFVNGAITLKNGSVLYAPRNVEMKNVNGRVVFKNSDVFIENLQCNVFNNKISMEGQAKNLITLINTEPNKVKIDWNIYSPSLNLASFTYLLKPRTKVFNKTHRKSKIANIARLIDQVLDQGSLDVTLKAGKLLYKKFEANNVKASVSLLQNSYIINNVSMEHAGGHMNLNGSLVQLNSNTYEKNDHQAKLVVDMDNVDVSKLFDAFNNFGQDGITSQSLEGKLTAKINVSLVLDEDGKTIPSSVESIVDFSLKNGALNNYEPLKKIQNFLLKNRDFDNIRFAELKDRLEIKNQEIKINRMEIQSSVMSMFVEGIYSKKGTTDMSIQVPFSNIKKRGADFNPENIGTDKKGGRGIFIRGRPGPDGNIKFKLDLFNKYNKEKKASS